MIKCYSDLCGLELNPVEKGECTTTSMADHV